MTTPASEFLNTAQERGFIHQCTDMAALDDLACKGPIPAYIGFDATADSLHAGSLVPIMLLRLLQRTGHKPIVLMGGGTTKVGDPSGKDEQRQLMDDARINANIQCIRRIFEKYLTFGDGPTDAVMVDNADWLDELEYIPFLREYGRHFSVNRMLGFDSVKLRLDREQPLSFLEFNYSITWCCRPMIFWNCRAARIACCKWVVQTSGVISWAASNWPINATTGNSTG
jgi:tyrosyl-tRNA synthetase